MLCAARETMRLPGTWAVAAAAGRRSLQTPCQIRYLPPRRCALTHTAFCRRLLSQQLMLFFVNQRLNYEQALF